jgi:hypothetical protein
MPKKQQTLFNTDFDYIKALSQADDLYAWYAADYGLPVTGLALHNAWLATSSSLQRFSVDLDFEIVLTNIEIENYHDSGGSTTNGAKKLIISGSNTVQDFTTSHYDEDNDLVHLVTVEVPEHSPSDVSDIFDITIPPNAGYRYIIFQCEDNWGGAALGFRQVRYYYNNDTESVGRIVRPDGYTDMYIKSSYADSNYEAFKALDPVYNYTGAKVSANSSGYVYKSWMASDAAPPYRFSIDFTTARLFEKVLIENYLDYDSGYASQLGIKEVKIYGSNSVSAFESSDPTDLTDMVEIADLLVEQHPNVNAPDPQEFFLSPGFSTYRYIILVINSAYNTFDAVGLRNIDFFDTDPPPPSIINSAIGFKTTATSESSPIGYMQGAISFMSGVSGYAGKFTEISPSIGFHAVIGATSVKVATLYSELQFSCTSVAELTSIANINSSIEFNSLMKSSNSMSSNIQGKVCFNCECGMFSDVRFDINSALTFQSLLYGHSHADQDVCELPSFEDSGRWA